MDRQTPTQPRIPQDCRLEALVAFRLNRASMRQGDPRRGGPR